MVPVAQHGLAGAFQLLADLCLVVVVEAVALVTEPDAHGHGQAEGVRLVETRADVVGPPGAHRVCPRGRQLLQRSVPAGATNEVRLTAAQQLPALPCLAQFHRDGLGQTRPRATAPGADSRTSVRAVVCKTVSLVQYDGMICVSGHLMVSEPLV